MIDKRRLSIIARHYAASLLEDRLAAAHFSSRGDGDLKKPIDLSEYTGRKLVLDTFENAPTLVKMFVKECDFPEAENALAEEMAALAESLRKAPTATSRREKWRQETPRDQLRTLLSAAWGDLSNIIDGVASDQAAKRALDFLEQAMEIAGALDPGEWS